MESCLDCCKMEYVWVGGWMCCFDFTASLTGPTPLACDPGVVLILLIERAKTFDCGPLGGRMKNWKTNGK